VQVDGGGGDPVSNAEVKLVPLDAPRHWQFLSGRILKMLYGDSRPWRACSDMNGCAVIEGLAAGRYLISLEHPELVSLPTVPEELSLSGGRHVWKAMMAPGRTVSGTIRNDHGEPVPQARVRVRVRRKVLWTGVLGGDKLQCTWTSAPTPVRYDGRGRLTIHQLPYAPLEIRASAEGHAPAMAEIAAQESELELVVRARVNAADSEVEAGGRLELRFHGGGCVVNLDSCPIFLHVPGTDHLVARELLTCWNGKATSDRLPAGKFDVVVAPHSWEPQVLVNITVPGAGVIDVTLAPAASIHVRTDCCAALRRVHVLDARGRMLRECVVDQGEFTVWGLRHGVYRLEGSCSDGNEYAATLDLTSRTRMVSLQFRRIPAREGEDFSAQRALGGHPHCK
jgi:hypothetical protein